MRRYYGVFWQKGEGALPDWARIVDKIEKGEKRIARSREIREALRKKVGRYEKPWQTLTINYGQSRGKIWTEEEDAYLVNMMHRYGYGNWERMRMAIRHAWQFKFDWFFKSRNALELQRRCDFLIRSIEKENEEFERLEKAKKKKAKSEGKGASASTPTSAVKSAGAAGGDDDADADGASAAANGGGDGDDMETDPLSSPSASPPPKKKAKVEAEE